MTLRITIAAMAALSLAACMGGPQRSAGFAATLPPPVAYSPSSLPVEATGGDGAILRIAQGYAGYHEGTRARAVGDVLTIVLVEDVDSRKSVQGRTDRSGDASITPPTSGPLGFLNPNALNAAAAGSFSGAGNARQRSSLDGTIAVTIAEVRGNGTALVVGEKQMQLSQGDEWVQFAGIVRLVDIDFDNRVPSTRVADARIVHSGRGALQQAGRPGWLSRFFSAVSPF